MAAINGKNQKRGPGAPRIPEPIERAIAAAWADQRDRKAGVVMEKVNAAFPARPVSLRTVRGRLAQLRAMDTSATWSLAGDPHDVELIVAAFRAALDRLDEDVTTFTEDQAAAVLLVARAAPDLDPYWQYRIAQARQIATFRGSQVDIDSITALVTGAPWRSREAMGKFTQRWLFGRRVVDAGEVAQGPPARLKVITPKRDDEPLPAAAFAPGVKTAAAGAPAGVVLKPIRGRATAAGYLIACEMEKESTP